MNDIKVSKSTFDIFLKDWKSGQYNGYRYGQAFYVFMKFHRLQNPFVEKLYDAPYEEAIHIINGMIEWEQ